MTAPHGDLDDVGRSADLSLDDIAREAYLYYFPLVVMERTRQQLCANALKRGIDLVANPFIHNRNLANAKWCSVARSNVDTLFSSCWLDTGSGAATMTVPESGEGLAPHSGDSLAPHSGERYFMYQVLDMWSDTYAVLGSRTLGDRGLAGGTFVGPGAQKTCNPENLMC